MKNIIKYTLICVIVLSCALFAFTGCVNNNIIEVETDEMVELAFGTNFYWSPGKGSWPGYPITLVESSENAVFECTISEGRFTFNIDPGYGLTAVVKSGDTIYWQCFGYIIPFPVATKAFVEIVLKIDYNITGYAVVKIYRAESDHYYGKLLKSALFPTVNGQYQEVTEEYVIKAIEKVKNKP